MSRSYELRRLEDVPAHEGDGRSVRLVRRELGIGAFGVNVFEADAGRIVIQPHTELIDVTRGHEELYIVLVGSATFTIDGDRVEAPRGTAVVVRDPGVERSAVANENGTTLLAIGAPIGEAFEPAPWEWSWTSFAALERGDAKTALEIVESGLELFPGNERLHRRAAEARARLQQAGDD